MTTQPINPDSAPVLAISKQDDGSACVKLSGNWNIRSLSMNADVRQKLNNIRTDKNQQWDMLAIEALDSAAVLLIWQAWGKKQPDALQIKPEHQDLFTRWQQQTPPAIEVKPFSLHSLLDNIGQTAVSFWAQVLSFLTLLGQLLIDSVYLATHPQEVPWAEISIAIFDAGVRALGITALVGFLIGIVLSYLSALQLKMFGAEIYIINILGLSVIRELGPLLAAILVAGRSGSAMSAQIGIMRVTEELDALSAMGISHSVRLVFPKVMALTIVLPLLSIWTSITALLGGMVAAQTTLDISVMQFFMKLPDVVPLMNVFIGLLKSATFGVFIALIACHFGFRIKPNTESLGNETTNSVVAAITIVIMIDAVFAILFMNVGMP
jgi:phospholipid/cholesterol/gamma-HCH transport system permease protein